MHHDECQSDMQGDKIMNNKTHYKVTGVDDRQQGQNQTACGYVRDNVSSNGDEVDCKLCLNSIHMVHYHAINGTITDSQGCY